MQAYRATITWADRPDTVEDHLEVISDAFNTALEGHGPAAGANLAEGTLDITFEVDVDPHLQPEKVLDIILAIFRKGIEATGLYPGDTEVNVRRITAESVEVRELQPA